MQLDAGDQLSWPISANLKVEKFSAGELSPLTVQARAVIPMQEIEDTMAVVTAEGFAIVDDDGATQVNDYLRKAGGWADKVKLFWTPKKQFWDAVHTACVAAERDTAPQIAKIQTACKVAIKAWIDLGEERRRRQQEELNRAAEQQRKDNEKAARVAALSGDVERASQILQENRTVRAPVIMPTATKLEGTSIRDEWTAECKDPMALLRAVAEGKVRMMHSIAVRGKGTMEVPVFVVNDAVLKFYATKLQKNLDWPGVEVKHDTGLSTRKL